MQNQGFLQTKEIFAIVLMLVAIKAADSTPSLFAQKAQNGFWLIPIVSFVVIFPSFLLMIYLLKRFRDKNLMELIESILGKTIGKLISIIIFLFAFSTLTLDSRNYVEQIKVLYFPESPTIFIFFIFIGVSFFGAKKGIEVIGYTSWIALPIIKISFFTLIWLVLGSMVYERIFPIFGSGLPVILSEGVKKAAIFAELFFLLIAYKAAKEEAMFRKGAVVASIIAFLEIIAFYFIYITVFDYNSVEKIAFPFHDIAQYVQFGQFFTNIETLFMVFWLFAAYLKFIVFLYLIAWMFGTIFHIKNFEPLLLPLAYLVIIAGLLPFNSIYNEFVLRENLLMIMSPFFILLPFMLWFIALWKGELKR
ncbi:spore germination protein [Gracilibacillus halophilus YIM-C55.5]|uniref:Spore germination protein n=1 Tax=Gracilibacillus halophilus YIM-C55.5 TaxID=1308866 RepID=N4WDY2_9BACI|nr:endospore germination permease [Gracilibacillus halophilus]ENH98468.1 spore germination protein [Gracilibacillus halophilus YIM-C55.5]